MITFILGLAAFLYLLHRIQLLERGIGTKNQSAPQPPRPVVVPRQQAPVPPPIPATPSPQPVPTMQIPINTPVVAASTLTVDEETESLESKTSEFEFGTKAFTIVGVLAVLIGVGFFLRYAFANNLISQGMRVALGCLLGVIVSATGIYLRKKYTAYGLSLFGGGLGILYISIYAGYDFYHILSLPVDFFILALISVVGITMSFMYESEPLVIYSLVGAYGIMMILPFTSGVNGFFLYLLVLNAIGFTLTHKKKWIILATVNAAASTLLLMKYLWGSYDHSFVFSVSLYLTLLYGAYVVISYMNIIRKRIEFRLFDGIVLAVAPVMYILFHFTIFTTESSRSLLMFIVGLLYVIISVGGRNISKDNEISGYMLLVGAGLIVAATAYHFNGSIVTYLLAIESIALIIIGISLKEKMNRAAGLILLLVSTFHMFFKDFTLSADPHALFNTRTLVTAFMTALYIIVYVLYRTKSVEENISEDESTGGTSLGLIGSYGLPFLWLSLEVWHFFGSYSHALSRLSIAWMLFALLTITIGFFIEEKFFRVSSYILFIIAIVFGFIDTWSLSIPHAVLFDFRTLIFCVGVFSLVCMYALIVRFRPTLSAEEQSIAPISVYLANFLLLLLGIREILDYFDAKSLLQTDQNILLTLENTKRLTLSAFLLVYGSISLIVGITFRSYIARILGCILFGMAVIKIFLYDTANLSDIYRFISFISLGVILLLAGFAYYRFKDRIIDFVKEK